MVSALLLALAQTFGPGVDVELPSLGGYADHATVAVNRYGDVVVANHTESAGGRKSVEATVFPSVGANLWQRRPPVLLGDAQRGVYGADVCHKPDVAALGDGSFALVWPRYSAQDPADCRLESARIVLRDAQGLLLAAPQVDLRGPGEGWVVDANLDAGIAGVMPDVCAQDGAAAGCYAVYAHEESSYNGVAGVVREYAVRAMQLDWSRNPNSPRWQDGPWLLGSGIGTDNRYSDPPVGGQVLPDVVVDDQGRVVVAWEEYWIAEHPGWSGGDAGRIRVRRYEKPVPGQPGVLVDEILRAGAQPARPQRRPMLSASREDAENRVLLAWNEVLGGGAPAQIVFESYVFSSGAPGFSGPTPGYWISDLIREEALPRPLLTSRSSLCFASRDYGSSRQVLAGFENTGNGFERMMALPAERDFAYRPAAAVGEFPRAGGGGPLRQVIAVSYEGGDTRDPDRFRIHLWITAS